MISRICVGTAAAVIAALLWLEWSSPVLRSLIKGRPVEILVLGLDEADGTRRADAIALVRLDPRAACVKILQIPRDTLVLWEGTRRRINSLYERGGPEAVREAVYRLLYGSQESLRGGGDIRFAVLDYQGFRRLYAELGSLEMEGRRADAEEALGLVRSREEGGDLERLSWQRGFLTGALQQLKNRPWMIPVFMARLRRVLRTDLAPYEAASLVWRTRSWVAPSSVYFFFLPGSPDERGHYRASLEETARLLPWWLGDGASHLAGTHPIRLEVLNAGGEPGLAFRWTRLLRSLGGFDVLYFGNAASEAPGSVLLVRDADLVLAKETLVRLNNETGLRLTQRVLPASRKDVHFTLLLGPGAGDSALLDKAELLEKL